METVELKVEGMDCEGCVKSVTRMLTGVDENPVPEASKTR